MGKNVWVTGNRSGGFLVKTEGAGRAAGIFDTQHEAIGVAVDMAKSRRSEVIIRGTDGRIRSKDSYGPDPTRRKDREH